MNAALLLLALVLASGATAQPRVPDLTGRVVDRGQILGATVEAELMQRLRQFEDSTTIQIAVLTVPSLNGENLERWATHVFRTWGLGQAEADNGVLLLIARDDRKIRIEVGYGLEADLTDAEAGAIIRDEMTPRFRNGDFGGGTLRAVDAIVAAIEGSYEAPRGVGSRAEPDRIGGVLLIGLPLLIFGFLLFQGFSQDQAGALGCFGMFLSAFVGWGTLLLTGDPRLAFFVLVGVPLAGVALNHLLERHPTLGPARRERRRIQELISMARKEGKTSVVIDGVTHTVPDYSSSNFSGGSSDSFSGGGGSSGGGGASGGW